MRLAGLKLKRIFITRRVLGLVVLMARRHLLSPAIIGRRGRQPSRLVVDGSFISISTASIATVRWRRPIGRTGKTSRHKFNFRKARVTEQSLGLHVPFLTD